jgi:hypothetical protein
MKQTQFILDHHKSYSCTDTPVGAAEGCDHWTVGTQSVPGGIPTQSVGTIIDAHARGTFGAELRGTNQAFVATTTPFEYSMTPRCKHVRTVPAGFLKD